MDRSSTRSSKYQPLIVEIPFSSDMLAERSDAQGITGLLNSSSYNEELLDLKEQLLTEFWRIVEQLTPRQQQVLRLVAKGFTQIEIAKQLGVNQSSITKSIHGNCDYRNGRRLYGGAKKRLAKIAAKDPAIQSIFQRIAEIKQEF